MQNQWKEKEYRNMCLERWKHWMLLDPKKQETRFKNKKQKQNKQTKKNHLNGNIPLVFPNKWQS